jgi:hypothetical protein
MTAFLNAAEARMTLAQDVTGNPECREQCNARAEAELSICDQGLQSCLADGVGNCYAVYDRCVNAVDRRKRACKASCRAVGESAASQSDSGNLDNRKGSDNAAAFLKLAAMQVDQSPECSTCQAQFDQDVNACVETFGLCLPDDPSFCETAACVRRAEKRKQKCLANCRDGR